MAICEGENHVLDDDWLIIFLVLSNFQHDPRNIIIANQNLFYLLKFKDKTHPALTV